MVSKTREFFSLLMRHRTAVGLIYGLIGFLLCAMLQVIQLYKFVHDFIYPPTTSGVGAEGKVTIPGGMGWISLGTKLPSSETNYRMIDFTIFRNGKVVKTKSYGEPETIEKNPDNIELNDEILVGEDLPVYMTDFLVSGISKVRVAPSSAHHLSDLDMTNVSLNKGTKLHVDEITPLKTNLCNKNECLYRYWVRVNISP